MSIWQFRHPLLVLTWSPISCLGNCDNSRTRQLINIFGDDSLNRFENNSLTFLKTATNTSVQSRNRNQRTNGPVNAHLISGPTKSTKTKLRQL